MHVGDHRCLSAWGRADVVSVHEREPTVAAFQVSQCMIHADVSPPAKCQMWGSLVRPLTVKKPLSLSLSLSDVCRLIDIQSV